MRRFVPRALLTTAALSAVAACASGGGGGGGGGVSLGGDTGGRYLIMVPALEGPQGDRVAANLRTLVSEMATHTAINDRDVQRSLQQYGIAALDEITARQLAAQIGAQLVTWGAVQQGGAGLQGGMKVIDTRTNDEIVIEDVTGANPQELASNLFSEMSRLMEGIAQAAYCNDHVSSQNYQQALETCQRALAVVPENSTALYGHATALLNLDRYEEALAEYEKLLELQPTHANALLGAGLASSRLDRSDVAMGFYRRYMEVNPGNVQVRMTLAYQIAQTDDYVSALDLLQPVASENASNAEFQRFLFGIATEAGRRLNERGDSAQARQVFQQALNAYQAAYSNGTELDASALAQAIAVNNALGRDQDALRLAEDATRQFPDNATMWDQLARVHASAERYQQAIEAMNRVAQLDPDFPDIYLRRGQAYLKAGNRQQALADLERAASAGDRSRVATLLLNEGAIAAREQRWDDAASVLEIARPYSEGETRQTVDYLLGASIAQQANALARSNIEAANRNVAQRALDMARRSLQLLQGSGHPSAGGVITGVQQLIASQEALLGGR